MAFLIQRFMLLPLFWFFYRVVHRMEIHGAEHLEGLGGRPLFLCPNHTSAWDAPVTGVYFLTSLRRYWDTSVYWTLVADPVRMVYRPVQYWCIWMGVTPVDRKAGMEQFTLQDALRVLRERTRNVVFGIYPEGTRSKDGRVARRGKVGIGWFQRRTGYPVVPIYHRGMPGLPFGRQKLQVWIGEPMTFEEYADEPDAPLTWKAIANDVVQRLRDLEAAADAREAEGEAPEPGDARDPRE